MQIVVNTALDVMTSTRFKLKLYVKAGISGQVLSRIYKALEHHRYNDYQLEIIDVAQEPDKAREEGIARTPILMSELPDGEKIVSDDLSDIDKLRRVFGFRTSK